MDSALSTHDDAICVRFVCPAAALEQTACNMGGDGTTLPVEHQLMPCPRAATASAPCTHRVYQLQHRQAGLEGWALWSIQPSEHPGK